jgi:hypothetical protein
VIDELKCNEEAFVQIGKQMAYKLVVAFTEGIPETADEALAQHLRRELAKTHKKRVRNHIELMHPKTISRVAIDMLESCLIFNYRPGSQLTKLIKELLGADKDILKADREFEARYTATWLLAQTDEISKQELARIIGINRTSVYRWFKDKNFHEEIAKKTRNYF